MTVWVFVFVLIACALAGHTGVPQNAINRRMSRRIRASRHTLFGRL